jgi:hypothetical protein
MRRWNDRNHAPRDKEPALMSAPLDVPPNVHPEVKRTPLHEIHEGLGANLVDFAG